MVKEDFAATDLQAVDDEIIRKVSNIGNKFPSRFFIAILSFQIHESSFLGRLQIG